jgi:hypothetical protein
MDFAIIPYVMIDGAWSLSDTTMIGLWDKIVTNELNELLFYSGNVQTPERFLQLVKSTHNVVNVVINEREIVFLSWLNDVGPNYAFGHFCAFPEVWGTESVNIGNRVVDYWFGHKILDKPALDTIIGKVPAINMRAVEYLKKLGFTILGTIPHLAHGPDINKRVGDVIVYKTRE